MINEATAKVEREGYGSACRYIIVDEFQDTSAGRFALIQAIRRSTGAKLMCVGDDWQSIFRFTGSDIGLFTRFGDHVGGCETVRLSHTYRNSQELVDIASSFVMKNGSQLKKRVVSETHIDSPVTSICVRNRGAALAKALSLAFEDASGAGIADPSVLVLGRNNSDLDSVFDDARASMPDSGLRRTIGPGGKDVRLSFGGHDSIRYLTVHRSKGLEADYVIVLNVVNDTYGFPNLVVDDPIISFLLDNGDDYPLAEERRLFYVALTRARRRVWLIADSPSGAKGPSPFVEEIERGPIPIPRLVEQGEGDCIPCPRCGGRIVRRTSPEDGRVFLGCSNYPVCTQAYSDARILEDRVACPRCGGWMTRRNGPYGPFFGCTNYPMCTATLNIGEAQAGLETSDG